MVSIKELERQIAMEKVKAEKEKKKIALVQKRKEMKRELRHLKHRKKIAVVKKIGGVIATTTRGFGIMAKKVGESKAVARMGEASRRMYDEASREAPRKKIAIVRKKKRR